MLKYIASILLLFCINFGYSQKTIVLPIDQTFAENMKSEYEDASMAAPASLTEVEFVWDKANQTVGVKEREMNILVSLKKLTKYPIVSYTDDLSEITDYSVNRYTIKNKKGANVLAPLATETYESDGIFYNDALVNYFYLNFPQAGIKRRVEIEKTYHNVRYFTSIYFKQHFPIEKKVVRLKIPKWLDIELKELNFDGSDITRTETMSGDFKVITYTANDLAPSDSESRSKGPSHIYPHLLILPKGYEYDGNKGQIFEDLDDLYGWYRDMVKLMDNDRAVFEGFVKDLVADATTEDEKIKAIYYWVQEHIRYIAFEDGIAGFKPANCQDVYNKKYGDCKGMANLTKEMLGAVGIDARLAWIGTRRLAYDYSTPCLSVDNHMICAVPKDGAYYFLDATEEFNELGEYTVNIQGKEVLIENGDQYILTEVPSVVNQENLESVAFNLSLEEDVLVGNTSIDMHGSSKAYFLYNVNNLKQDKVEEALRRYLNNDDKNYKVTNVQTSDLDERDGIIELDYDVAYKNAVSSFGEEMYLDIDFEKEFNNWTFDEDRNQDYLFSQKIFKRTKVKLQLPIGYMVSALPEAFERKHKDFEFQLNWQEENGHLIYEKLISIPNAEIKKQDFETWNGFIKDLSKQYKNQLVLVKKS